MHLLGDVGEMEIGAEGPNEQRRGLQVDALEQLGECLVVGPAQHAHPLDKVEQRLTLLAYEGFAQQVAEPADVGTQGGRLVALDSAGSRHVNLLCWQLGRRGICRE